VQQLAANFDEIFVISVVIQHKEAKQIYFDLLLKCYVNREHKDNSGNFIIHANHTVMDFVHNQHINKCSLAKH